MRYQGADQNFIQRNSLDIYAFLFFTVYFTIKLVKFLLAWISSFIGQRAKKIKVN